MSEYPLVSRVGLHVRSWCAMVAELSNSTTEVEVRFKHRMQVVAIENRPARNNYPASTWALLADGEGEPLQFRCGTDEAPVPAPPVFQQIDAELLIVGRSFGQKKSTSYVLTAWSEPKG